MQVEINKNDGLAILSAASGIEKSMLNLLMKAGLSYHNLMSLQWSDIDIDKEMVAVWEVSDVPRKKWVNLEDVDCRSLLNKETMASHNIFVFVKKNGERYSASEIKKITERCMSIGGVKHCDIGVETYIKLKN